jgi:hypothetical protein
MVGLCDNLL